MDPVKLQCLICCSVGEIKNHFLQPVDAITVLPIVELSTCKHQLCAMCVRKIAQRGRDRRVECPMCRRKNAHFTVYSVNRDAVDALRCGVGEVREHGRFHGLVDAASLARGLFERSLLEAEPAAEDAGPAELRSVLQRLQTRIDEQSKANYDAQARAGALAQAVAEVNGRLDKSRLDYSEACKQVEALRDDISRKARALRALQDEHGSWADKNAALRRENERLTNENIGLIRDNNLFRQSTARKRKTAP